jgi:tetratricopeptide (TPR) repeat protein
MSGRVIRFPKHSLSLQQAEQAAEHILSQPQEERVRRKRSLQMEDPETLLAVCSAIRGRLMSDPSWARDEAEFFFQFIDKPRRDIGLFDERHYFLGELALLAGAACRQLSRREEAWIWFDRSEAGFRHTINAAADLSRLAYQRLAERLEERQFDVVLELLPSLVESFRTLGMAEDALKARFLEGMAFLETDEPTRAAEVFSEIADDPEANENPRLRAAAYTNLTHVYGMVGDAEAAIAASARAIPVFRQLNDRIGLAKVQWGLASVLRESGQIPPAIEAYRQAQQQFEDLGMRADVAALNLVLADLLLDQGQNNEALREISAALPVIDELKMAPEGMAALSLLRESALRQQVNRAALRELHGYFPQPDA